MKSLKLSILTAILAVTMPYLASAQEQGNEAGNGRQVKGKCQQVDHKRGPAAKLEMLNLTDDQKQKVEKLQFDHQKKVLGIKNQLGEKRAKLRTMTTADAPDTKAINALIDEMGALKTQLMKEHITVQLAIRALLNEEQRLQFDTQCQHRGMRGEGRNHGRGNGQGMGYQPGMDNEDNPGLGFDDIEFDESWQ